MKSILLMMLQILVILLSIIENSYHFELIILHSNNVNFRFEQRADKTGGAGKVLYLLSKLKRKAEEGKGPPVLYLNAGDNFSPIPLYILNQWDVIADYLNILRTDAVCLGNHDLNIGLTNLTKFLRRLEVPVVTANIQFRYHQTLQKYIQPSKIFHINNRKVGVVGTTTARTEISFLPKFMFIEDEIKSLRKECARLHYLGVDIIIILSHAGVEVDKLIAKFVDHVDIIVGSGRRYDKGRWRYEEMVKRKDGKYVPIIRDEGHMTSLGVCKIEFDQNGDVLQHNGKLVFLHNKIPHQAAGLKSYLYHASGIKNWRKTTMVTLSSACTKAECNFGNLIADSLVHHKALDFHGSAQTIGWSDYPISMIHSGMITKTLFQNYELNNMNIYSYIDFFDTYVNVRIYGSYLKEAILEATQYYGYSSGLFLQFSGLHVEYNLTESYSRRIVRITARCGFCKTPFYSVLMDNEEYFVMVNFETFRRITLLEKKLNSVSMSYQPIGFIAASYFTGLPYIFAEETDRLLVLAKAVKPITSQTILYFLYIITLIAN